MKGEATLIMSSTQRWTQTTKRGWLCPAQCSDFQTQQSNHPLCVRLDLGKVQNISETAEKAKVLLTMKFALSHQDFV